MSGLVISLTHDVLPLDKRLDAGMRKAINALADRDNVIILGRCADYYLAGRTNLVRTFFINNEEDRIDLIREKFDVSRKEAQKAIAKTGKRQQIVTCKEACGMMPGFYEMYEKVFHTPEAFVKMGRGLMVLPIDDETVKSNMREKDAPGHDAL